MPVTRPRTSVKRSRNSYGASLGREEASAHPPPRVIRCPNRTDPESDPALLRLPTQCNREIQSLEPFDADGSIGPEGLDSDQYCLYLRLGITQSPDLPGSLSGGMSNVEQQRKNDSLQVTKETRLSFCSHSAPKNG